MEHVIHFRDDNWLEFIFCSYALLLLECFHFGFVSCWFFVSVSVSLVAANAFIRFRWFVSFFVQIKNSLFFHEAPRKMIFNTLYTIMCIEFHFSFPFMLINTQMYLLVTNEAHHINVVRVKCYKRLNIKYND